MVRRKAVDDRPQARRVEALTRCLSNAVAKEPVRVCFAKAKCGFRNMEIAINVLSHRTKLLCFARD